MNAFYITATGETGYGETPEPVVGAGEVLLAVDTVGFCGSDLNTFRGLNPMVTYPRIPGHEIGARIAAMGADVPAAWTVGQTVTCSPYTSCGRCSACRQGRFNCCRDNQTFGVQRDGAMTPFVTVPHEKLFRADGLGVAELAMVEPLTVGFHAVDRARVQAGETVLVFGCGAVGLGAIAGASARDAIVVAADIDEAKLDLARAVGATHTLHSTRDDLPARLRELTDGEGPAAVIEAVGLPATFRAAVDLVCFAGRVVYIGYAKAPVEYETKYFVQKELDIMGSRNAMPADFRAVIAHLQAGRFPMARALSRTVSFADAGRALAEWSADPAAITKIQVKID
jgi:threonine dehydrogenase-like Zn-dependent dehydrogenase